MIGLFLSVQDARYSVGPGPVSVKCKNKGKRKTECGIAERKNHENVLAASDVVIDRQMVEIVSVCRNEERHSSSLADQLFSLSLSPSLFLMVLPWMFLSTQTSIAVRFLRVGLIVPAAIISIANRINCLLLL